MNLRRLAGLVALFFGLAAGSYVLTVPHTPLSLIWLPNVIAAVIETRAPRRHTAETITGLIVGTMCSHVLTGASPVVILIRCTGTLLCIGSFVAASRVLRLERHAPSSTLGYCSITLLFCTAVALAASIVSMPLVSLGVAPDYPTAWSAWWLANAATCCLVFPIALTASPKLIAESVAPRALMHFVSVAGGVLVLTLIASRYIAVPYVEISTTLIIAALLLPLFSTAVLITVTLVGYAAASYVVWSTSSWAALHHDLELLPTALMMGGAMLVALIKQEREERQRALNDAVAALEAQQSHLEELVDARTAQLRASNAELDLANRQKDLFLANTSHEMRTPLHAIHAFAKMGRERLAFGRVDKVKIYLERIDESATRLSYFVDNLLNLSRMIAGKVSLAASPVQLSALVAKTVAAVESITTQKAQRVEVLNRRGEQPVALDTGKFQQVLTNLLSNAIRFSPQGARIEIALDDAQLDGKPAVRIAVSDEGVGIPEAELSSIFDSFVQSSRTADGAGGTGLGLSISREIVRLHNGTITAHNRAAGGACFEVLLPVTQAATPTPKRASAPVT